jgi:dihydropteroate synthase
MRIASRAISSTPNQRDFSCYNRLFMRTHFQWDIGRRKLPLGERTLIMGVLNVTPDSFSDGGRYLDPQAAIAHGLALLDEGADILDIGGESTRPGAFTVPAELATAAAPAVSAQEELDRVLPILEAITKERPDSILSVDTYKSVVARYAIDAGAEIVNDVSGFTWDSAMALTIAERPCGAILMHTRGFPNEWRALPPVSDIVALVREELRACVSSAIDQGVSRSSIVIDPGFGFGKNFDENYSLLAHLADFRSLGFPLLAAASRKGFLGNTISARLAEISRQPAVPVPPTARDTATLAASVAAALAGAHIVRVHAVRPAVEALAIADTILRAG